MVALLLFGPARGAACISRIDIEAPTVGDLVETACELFGCEFAAIVETSAVWLNGEPTDRFAPVSGADEVAVLPPVSGG